MLRGKVIVLAMVLLAAALAGGNMWYQSWLSRRAIRHWGAAGAQLIARGPRVEALRLGAADDAAAADKSIVVGETRYAIEERVDATHARGLLHIRRALLINSFYDWNSAADVDPQWRYALRFSGQDAVFSLLLSVDCLTAAEAASPHPVSIHPDKMGESPLRAFVEEQFERGGSKTEACQDLVLACWRDIVTRSGYDVPPTPLN